MNFLTLTDLSSDKYPELLQRGLEMKQELKSGGAARRQAGKPLAGKSCIMLFEKPSTRTRVSFEVGVSQLGGAVVFISGQDSQRSRGEPIKDTAKVMSAMADGIIIRNNSHQQMQEFAKHSSVCVINALSSDYHPCQLLADMMTYQELRGSIRGKRVVWCGDGNNMCNSYMEAAEIFGFELTVAAPAEFAPREEMLAKHNKNVTMTQDIAAALAGADLVCTDVWVSMGDKDADAKRQVLRPYQVTAELLAKANADALFMHCLPAREGEEIAAGLLEHPQSAVWVQAENRLHAQKALLELLYRD